MADPTSQQSPSNSKAEKKAEAERYMARLYRKAAPAWFNILGWIALLGAIEYFRQQSGNGIFWVILIISYFLLGAYFFTLITSIEFDILPESWSPRVQRLIAALFTGALFGFTFFVYTEAIRSIASVSKSDQPKQEELQHDAPPLGDDGPPPSQPEKQKAEQDNQGGA